MTPSQRDTPILCEVIEAWERSMKRRKGLFDPSFEYLDPLHTKLGAWVLVDDTKPERYTKLDCLLGENLERQSNQVLWKRPSLVYMGEALLARISPL
jgi:hypothetical protein